MNIQFVHIFGPVLFTIAFLVFGRGIVARSRGRRFRPLPAFILLLIAIAYRFLVSKETLVEAYGFVHPDSNAFDMLLDRLTIILMDFGIAMVVDAGYLAYKKQHSKMFWVPGVIAFVLSLVMYLFATVIDRVADGFRSPDRSERAELLLELGPDDHIQEVRGTLRRYNACYQRAFEYVDPATDAMLDGPEDKNLAQYYAVFVDEAFITPLIKELRADHENVDQVDANHEVQRIEPFAGTPNNETQKKGFIANDPEVARQWYAQTLEYDAVHRMLRDLKPRRRAKVAIIDSGVESGHEDLKSIFDPSEGRQDGNGHGTHCAGLAAASTNNRRGVASLNWEGRYLRILSYPALNPAGIGTDRTVAQAVINAANAGADVISMSLGGPGSPPKSIRQAIAYARNKGAIVVVAAGNSNRNARDFTPASVDGVITVSAVDPSLNKARFSNTNTSLKMPLAAPGVDMLSAYRDGEYKTLSGTSMATPVVSGLIGIMRAFKPSLTPGEAHKILHDTGRQVSDSPRVGKVVQPYPALKLLLEGRPI